MKFLLITVVFILANCSLKRAKSKNDIYVNKFVYNKIDSSLFTGLLENADEGSSLKMNFIDGIPSGEWIETDKGGNLVQKGIFMESQSLRSKLGHGISLIDSWQEGQHKFLTVSIIQNDSFFSSDNEDDMKDSLKNLFEKCKSDLLSTKRRGVFLKYINAIYNWDKSFYLYYDCESKTIEFDKYGNW